MSGEKKGTLNFHRGEGRRPGSLDGTEGDVHRITDCLRSEGISGGHPVQAPNSSRATQSWFPRTMSRKMETPQPPLAACSSLSQMRGGGLSAQTGREVNTWLGVRLRRGG